MSELFTESIIWEYNTYFQEMILHACPCYLVYKDFIKFIFKEKNTYSCCLLLSVDKELKVNHRCLPIMIGSYIDNTIRGYSENPIVNDQYMLGSFLVSGNIYILPNFLTNNLRNGHAYRQAKNTTVQYKWNFTHDSNQVNIVYEPNKPLVVTAKPIKSTIQRKSNNVDSAEQKKKKLEKTNKEADVLLEKEYNEALSNAFNKQRKRVLSDSSDNDDDDGDNEKIPHKTLKLETGGEPDYDWLAAVNDLSLFKDDPCTADEYMEFFDISLKLHPDLDSLANKTIITAPSLLYRVITMCIQSGEREIAESLETALINKFTKESLAEKQKAKHTTKNVKKSTVCSIIEAKEKQNKFIASERTRLTTKLFNRLTTITKNGNMYYALSNRNINSIKAEYKNMYLAVEGCKMSQIDKMTSMVKRFSNNQTRNSNALMYPVDAQHFICPLNLKEMKEAGETTFLSQFTIVTIEIPDDNVIVALNQYTIDKNLKENHMFMVIEGCLTHRQIENKIEAFLNLKKEMPFVTLMRYEPKYLLLSTRGHIPVKYSMKYECFVSPHEAKNMFTDAFDDYPEIAKFSSSAVRIPSIHKALPEKITVALNNSKLNTHVIRNSGLSLYGFIHSVGYHSGLVYARTDPTASSTNIVKEVMFDSTVEPMKLPLDFNNDEKAPLYYLKYAIMEADMPKHIVDFFAGMPESPADNIEINGRNFNELMPNMKHHLNNINGAFRSVSRRLAFYVESPHFRANYIRGENYELLTPKTYKTNVNREVTIKNDGMKVGSEFVYVGQNRMTNYIKKIATNQEAIHRNQLVLYTAFGDVGGGTCEDGIILDKSFVENGPLKMVSVTLNIRIHDKGVGFKRNAKCSNKIKISYESINEVRGIYLIFGKIVSDRPLNIIKTRAVHAVHSKLGRDPYASHRYLIFVHEYSNMDKTLESSYHEGLLTIHYRYLKQILVATKIANQHGQKGLVCRIADLSHMKFWQRDGTCIHPQILFSISSTIGRTMGSQTYEMLTSNKVAIGERYNLCAPMSYTIHYIEANTKASISQPKNDLMTDENGFQANNLVTTSHCLRTQTKSNRSHDTFHLVSEMFKTRGINMSFVDYHPEAIENIKERNNYLFGAYGDRECGDDDDNDDDANDNEDDDDDNDSENEASSVKDVVSESDADSADDEDANSDIDHKPRKRLLISSDSGSSSEDDCELETKLFAD